MANPTEIAVKKAEDFLRLKLLNQLVKETENTVEYDEFKGKLKQMRDDAEKQ